MHDLVKKMTEKINAEVDQDGKMINPHNPEFITKVPWYLGDSGPTLKHHNIQKSDKFLSIADSDKLIQNKVSTAKRLKKEAKKNTVLKYRKGSCKNCGSMTHSEKDCLERPRSSKISSAGVYLSKLLNTFRSSANTCSFEAVVLATSLK